MCSFVLMIFYLEKYILSFLRYFQFSRINNIQKYFLMSKIMCITLPISDTEFSNVKKEE